jgi:putative endonuclease
VDKKQLGTKGEILIANHYAKNGFNILHQNLRTPFSEIDILAEKQNQIYVLEVKTISSQNDYLINSWFKTQRRRLIKSIKYLLATNQLTSTNLTCHFIVIDMSNPNKVRCKRYKNIPLCI